MAQSRGYSLLEGSGGYLYLCGCREHIRKGGGPFISRLRCTGGNECRGAGCVQNSPIILHSALFKLCHIGPGVVGP